MSALTAVLWGWVAGITGVVLCLLYGFDTLLFIMRLPRRLWSRVPFGGGGQKAVPASPVDASMDRHNAASQAKWLEAARKSKRSLREQGLEGVVAGATSEVSQLKLASTCILSWYEDGATGIPVRCRFVLTGSDLSIYEVLPSGGGGGPSLETGTADGSERGEKGGKGKADGDDRNVASAEHLRGVTDVGRLHVHFIKAPPKNKNKPNNPFTGRLVVLTTADKQPVVGAREAGDDGGAPRGPCRSPLEHSLGAVSSGTPASATPELRPCATGSASQGPSDAVPGGAAAAASRRGMSGWTSVVVKFRDSRESERWYTLLRGLKQANAWREAAKSLPNPDTANALLSRFLFQNMQGEGLAQAIKKLIQKQLKKISINKFPRDVTGEILLDSFDIGKCIPWISDVSEPTVSTNGEFGFDFNIHYKANDDGFVLRFRCALAYRDVRVPHFTVSLKLHELEGTVHVSIGPPPSKKFWIAGCRPPILRVEVHQGCASGRGLLHRILTSLPDLSGIATNLLKLYFLSQMVLPYMDDFPLPNFEKTPKTSPRASPKTRVFDRRRAAEKSAAPTDLAVLVPSPSTAGLAPPHGTASSLPASPNVGAGGGSGDGRRGATLSSLTEGSGGGGGGRGLDLSESNFLSPTGKGVDRATDYHVPAAFGGDGLLSSSNGTLPKDAAEPQSRGGPSSAPSPPALSPVVASPWRSSEGVSPMWASTARRGAATNSGESVKGGALFASQRAATIGSGEPSGAFTLRSMDSRTPPPGAYPEGSGAFAATARSGVDAMTSQSQLDAIAELEETATSVTSGSHDQGDNTRKAKKTRAADLKSSLKRRGKDMVRAVVAKVDRPRE